MSENFKINLVWLPEGKTFTYNEYSREYKVSSPEKTPFTGSAAVEYKGSAKYWNPEEMLVSALSSCHMLSYLALAANAKIEILSYSDDADGALVREGMGMKFGEVTLRPQIKLANANDKEKAEALHEKAHKICFIANSVNFPVHLKPTFE